MWNNTDVTAWIPHKNRLYIHLQLMNITQSWAAFFGLFFQWCPKVAKEFKWQERVRHRFLRGHMLLCDHAWISGHCLHQLICLSLAASDSRTRCYCKQRPMEELLIFLAQSLFFLLTASVFLTYAHLQTHSFTFSLPFCLVNQQRMYYRWAWIPIIICWSHPCNTHAYFIAWGLNFYFSLPLDSLSRIYHSVTHFSLPILEWVVWPCYVESFLWIYHNPSIVPAWTDEGSLCE